MRSTDEHLSDPGRGYQPATLLDALCTRLTLRSDAELARILWVERALIAGGRAGVAPLSGVLLLAMHQVSGKAVARMRALAGDRRRKLRMAPSKATAAVLQRPGSSSMDDRSGPQRVLG